MQTGLEWAALEKVPGLNLLPQGLRGPIADHAHGEPPTRYLGDIA